MRSFALLSLFFLTFGGACGENGGESAGECEIVLESGRREVAIGVEDPRHGALQSELARLLAGAGPAEDGPLGELRAWDSGRGALEFRFPARRSFRTASGDSLEVWRLRLYLDSWPPPDGGALLLLGYPDWQRPPWWSEHSCREIWAILEG